MPSMTPVIPPIVKLGINASAHIIAVVVWILDLYKVASQLKIFTPVGTAIAIVETENTELTNAPAPIVKKWCTQTRKLSPAIRMIDQTMTVYPNNRFLEKVAITSENIPNAGSI